MKDAGKHDTKKLTDVCTHACLYTYMHMYTYAHTHIYNH